MPEPAAEPVSENRQSVRQKSFLRCVVYFDNSPCAIDCMVRDISDTGARIKFSNPPARVADVLELQIPLKGQKHTCKIAWRRDDEIGVLFADMGASSHRDNVSISERMTQLEAEIAALKQIIKRMQKSADKTADVA